MAGLPSPPRLLLPARMTLTATEIWSRLLDRARLELPEQTFRTWLEPTEALSLDWNDSKHSELLASLAPVAVGHPVNVVFKVHEERKTRTQMDLFVAPPPQPPKPAAPAANATTAPLSSRYTFDHFVIGKSNELAAAAAQAAAQAPGKVYNPLFLYGDTGLGKTHLMQAVAHALLAKDPSVRVTFVGTEQFTNELVASIQGRTT